MYCNPGGCKNVPQAEEIKNAHANDRHKARHVINVLKAFQKAIDELNEYKRLLESDKSDLKRQCKDFAKVFFHGKIKGKTCMCPAKILQINMIVLSLLLGLHKH